MNTTSKEIFAKDEYQLLYEMMIHSLKSDNVTEGIKKSLFMLKDFLNSGDIVLYRKDENGLYEYYSSQTNDSKLINVIIGVINRSQTILEKKGHLKFDLNIMDGLENLNLIYFQTDEKEYVFSMNNIYIENDYLKEFINKLTDTLKVILHRAELYEHNTRAINTDLLTGLDNRNSYEKKIEELENSGSALVYCLFDLFRLKFVNDEYNHALGDKYIKEAARILSRYWPKYYETIEQDGIRRKIETGSCIYRIGGDEFVLLSEKENYNLTMVKASLAGEELENIELHDTDKFPIGLNY